MNNLQVNIPNGLLGREARALRSLMDRFGFELSERPESGLVTATRPRVMEKPDFVDRIVLTDTDSRYFGGVAWNRLRTLGFYAAFPDRYPSFEGLPLRFFKGGWSGGSSKPNLLEIDTLPPSVEWVGQHMEAAWFLNERTVRAWGAVAETLIEFETDNVAVDN